MYVIKVVMYVIKVVMYVIKVVMYVELDNVTVFSLIHMKLVCGEGQKNSF